MTLIGVDETVAGTSGAGTPTTLSTQRFSRFQGSIKRETVDLGNITAAELTYGNNLDTARFISGSAAVGAIDPSDVGLSGSLTARFADLTLLNDASAATGIELEFAYTVDANTSLVITVHEARLPRAKRTIQGPGGIEATYNWQASRQSGGGQSLTAVLKNDVASY